MFKGTVKFRARIKGNGLTFPLFAFNPNEPGVEKFEIEGPNGDEILSTVYLASVATEEDGLAIAMKVNTAALNRISFFRDIIIETARITDTAHYAITGYAPRLVHGIRDVAPLRAELEQASPAGEQHFGLFRSARQSLSPVEGFMHLYNILLMLFNDAQADADAFILHQDHKVTQTPHPLKVRVMETVYTRLRNELAHKRPGVNLDNTKAEMANRLDGLVALTKRAIELHS